MRNFERLTPFKGERSQWRNWSQKARCAARAAGLERVMMGKATRPDDAEGFNAVEAWESQNRRIHTRLVMLMEGSADGVIREDLEGDEAAAWRVLERRYGALMEQQGEKLLSYLKKMRMKHGEEFDDYALRIESTAIRFANPGCSFQCKPNVEHYSRPSPIVSTVRSRCCSSR